LVRPYATNYFCRMENFYFILMIFLLSACDGNEETNEGASVTKTTTNEAGKQLFYSRCASCHMINKDLTGPALKGVESRWPDKQKLYAFIRNSEAVIEDDKYAYELWLKYNQTMMNKHPDLTNDQIKQILDYINSVSETVDP
jgi:mono/diheme cytochrome c family protein